MRRSVGSPTPPKPGIVERAQPHGQHDPPAGEMVERHRLARELPGAATGGRGHDRPEADPLGAHGNSGQRHPRVVDRIGARNGHAIPIEDAVPTGIFRFRGHRGDLMDVARGEDDSVAHVVPPERVEKRKSRG